ncbi:MAG: hypothetical protein ACI3ZD_05565, partial [Prevotella sp.]
KALKAIILKVQARMPVLMKWAERLMTPYPYPHFLSHLLYRRSPDIIQPLAFPSAAEPCFFIHYYKTIFILKSRICNLQFAIF